jgi:hypothetical protein
MKTSLKDRAKQLSNTLPFMETREKADLKDLHGKEITVTDYGFLTGDDGDFACFTIKEDKENFYFAGGVLTQHLKTFEDEGYHAEIVKEGLKIKLYEKVSKNKKTYTAVEFL